LVFAFAFLLLYDMIPKTAQRDGIEEEKEREIIFQLSSFGSGRKLGLGYRMDVDIHFYKLS
jgi:hypothetical protein